VTVHALPLLMHLGDGFHPGRARGVHAAVEWRVTTPDGVERLWMRIDDGSWLLTSDQLEASLTIELALSDLAAVVEGPRAATRLFMEQRLTLTGDVLLAVRLPDFFGVRRRREARPRLRPRRTAPAALQGS
jgi:SCP-2 sterol transfer family